MKHQNDIIGEIKSVSIERIVRSIKLKNDCKMNYEKIYNAIVSKAKAEDRKKIKDGIYYERHHIIPKCMGGSNDKSNLILLTAKEHYMSHRLLCEIYPDNRLLLFAMRCMINGLTSSKKRYIPYGRIYARLKEAHSLLNIGSIRSDDTRKKMSSAAKGKLKGPMSSETKKKLSDLRKGSIHSEETKKKMSGKIRSEETKKKMSESAKGRIMSEESKQKIGNASKGRNIGRIITEESRKRMSDAKIGKVLSDETKKKMQESQKNRWNKKLS
jgi:hypothetical protein